MIWKWLPSLFVNCKSGKDTALVMLNFAPLLVFSPILSFWPAEWQNGNNIRKERKVKWTSGASGQWLYPLLFSLRVFLIKRLVLNDKQATLYLHQRLQAVCNLAKKFCRAVHPSIPPTAQGIRKELLVARASLARTIVLSKGWAFSLWKKLLAHPCSGFT